MGKKAKKRARSVQKVKHGPAASPRTESQASTSNAEVSEGGVSVTKDREVCSHIDKGINFDALITKLGTSGSSLNCEDCRGDRVERLGKKGKGKGKVSKSDSKAIWVCLACGHFSCGGAGLPTTQQSHSVWHAKKNHHPLVVHYKNHQLAWCYPCSKLISAEISEDNKLKEVLCEVVKKVREQTDQVQGSIVDVEDVWFASGSVTSAIKSEYSAENWESGYLKRGLVNLGNTCFFNSIMQNLLAVKRLRDLLLASGESAGPLSAAMRKLFLETSAESNSRSAINPRSVFGSLCTKAPQFRGYQQHDSHELLRCLLDALSSEELGARKQIVGCSLDSKTGPTLVDSIFGGQLSSTVRCLECGHSSTIFEPFLDLSLPVPIKNSANKRAQPIGRGKKSKLPPKRSVRNQSKTGKVNVAKENVSNQVTSGSSKSEMQPQVEPGNQLVLFQGESALSNTVDANGVAFDVHSMHEDGSDTKIHQNQQPVENVSDQSASLDCFSWLDYLEPNPPSKEDYASLETDKIEPNNGFEIDDPLNDVTYSTALDTCTESNLVSALSAISLADPDKSADDLEPVVPAQEQHHVPEFEEKSNAYAEVGEESPETHPPNEIVEPNTEIISNSGLSNQLCATDSCKSQRGDEEDHSKIQDLTFPMEDVEPQVSSSVVGEEQVDLDFNGFGNLFDEPEANLDLKPSDDRVSEASYIAKIGLNGNSSDSEPNEVVDDKDGPVSVESCFASFTKPELLSKDEHGWQCDNCSKILQEQRIASKKIHQMHRMEILPSRCKDPAPNGMVDVVRTRQNITSIDMNVEKDHFDSGSVPLNEDIHDNGNCIPFEMANQCQDSTECSSLSCKCCTGECDHTIEWSATETVLSPREGESADETEREEAKVEKLKVKRDATKSIFVNKAPAVLTIHLKRFSQEGRGRLSKLNGHVKFKETIDLKPYMDPRVIDEEMLKYRLIGVVEHLGNMRGGHYVAYVRGGDTKNGYGDCWYHASDAYVRESFLDEVLQCQAYILFYERT